MIYWWQNTRFSSLKSSEGVLGSLTFAMHLCFHTLFHLRFCTHTVAYVATVTLKDQQKPFKPVSLSHHTCNHLGTESSSGTSNGAGVYIHFFHLIWHHYAQSSENKVSKIAEVSGFHYHEVCKGKNITIILCRHKDISNTEAIVTQNEHTYSSSPGCNDAL